MKIAIVYNRDSQEVINLFGIPNREKYGLQTINLIRDAIKQGGYQVKTFEGDKKLIANLEEYMPTVISGERPGLVFNLSYGIQGRARYTHVPGILEMLGIPYVGSGPETQAIALDKVVTKVILMHKGLPTPKFAVLDNPDSIMTEELEYPLIVKPKDESVSLGLRIVNNEEELRAGVQNIYDMFKAPTLVEEYIPGREVNVGLLGNDPVEALPPVELNFGTGEQIFTFEDKTNTSNRRVEKVCPINMPPEEIERLQTLAIAAFKALGCSDSARVDFRLDHEGNPYILEVNSLPSLGPDGSYVFAAKHIGLEYGDLVNRLVEVASKRYFGVALAGDVLEKGDKREKSIFTYLTKNRDKAEEELKSWTNLSSRTDDPAGLSAVLRKLSQRATKLGLEQVDQFTNSRSAWTWQTKAGFKGGTLLVVPLDSPREKGGYPVPFRRDPEWLYGEGIASSRAGLMCILQSMEALRSSRRLQQTKVGIFAYTDEGRGMRYSNQLLSSAAQEAERVIILQPGFGQGKVVDQRRGSRKYSILVEGNPQRIGSKGYTDVLSWFLQKVPKITGLSQNEQKLAVVIQDVHSERFSVLMPHRVRVTVYVTYLNPKLADKVEAQLEAIFSAEGKGIQAYMEKLEERPPMTKSLAGNTFISQLQHLSEQWKLPFGVDSSLLPSAGGAIPLGIPVVCGFAPACRDLYTPQEAVHRGELLQRSLLLTLFLLESQGNGAK